MIEKPLMAIASLARKSQVVATRIALKSAKLADSMARKAASIQLRAAARAQERAVRAMAKRPSIHFLREVRHGQMSVSFYRSIDHRRGTVREFWSLARDTPRGRVRLASGSMSEFRSLSNIAERGIRREEPRALAAERTRRQPRREKGLERRAENGREPTLARRTSSEPEREPNRRRWHTLVYVEGANRDGTIRTRVVRNFAKEEDAQAYQRKNPALVVHRRDGSLPLRQGSVITVRPDQCPDAAARLEARERKRAVTNENGHDRAAERTRAVAQLPQQREQRLSLSR